MKNEKENVDDLTITKENVKPQLTKSEGNRKGKTSMKCTRKEEKKNASVTYKKKKKKTIMAKGKCGQIRDDKKENVKPRLIKKEEGGRALKEYINDFRDSFPRQPSPQTAAQRGEENIDRLTRTERK